jgi:hypothetical protein
VVSERDAREAAEAFRRFGLAEAAQIIEDALALDDEMAREGKSSEYYEATASLKAAFAHYYANHPEEFEPPW